NDGVFFCGNNILTVYIADDSYEKHLYPYFKTRTGYFIDIGAHIGKYSVKVAKNSNVPVIAIEPDTFNFSLLKKNVALNGLKNVICINKGVLSEQKKSPLYVSGRGEGSHSFFKQPDTLSSVNAAADTLDSIVSDLRLTTK